MTWIKLHADVFANKKISLAAAALTRGDVEKMVGHLARLWTWADDNVEDGDLGHLRPAAIAQAAGWTRNARTFIQTLLDVRLLDPGLRIHDWEEYAGRLIERRRLDRERKQAERGRKREGPSPQDRPMERPTDSRLDSPRDVRYPREETEKEKRKRESDGLAPSLLTDPARVREAAGHLISIKASGNGLYDCVLTRSEAEALMVKLLGDHEADLVFAAIESLRDVSEGFKAKTRVGQVAGIAAWVRQQKPPLLDTVRELLAQTGDPRGLLDEAGIPDDGIEHATTESLHRLHELLLERLDPAF